MSAVLEGSVRKAGDHVRITTQLINTEDGSHRWSETYDRKLSDVFAVQDEIAKAVVGVLRVKLLLGKSPGALEHRTSNTDAYLDYLAGRGLMERELRRDSWRRAQEAFQHAVDRDPSFAPAWAGLGYMRSRTADYLPTVAEHIEFKARALTEINKSLALAPDFSEAYTLRGIMRLRDQFDWSGAQTDFERSLALNPEDPFALEQYGYWFQAWRGQLREAAQSLRKAVERDPINASLWHRLGCIYLFSGEMGEARKAFDHEYEISGAFSSDDGWPMYLLILEGKAADALNVAGRMDSEAWRLAGAALAQHALGHEQQSIQALASLRADHAAGFSVQVAQIYAYRGETAAAFEWLERAHQNRDPGMMRLKVDPLLRMLRGDPRYTALLKKMNLPLD